MCLRCYPSHHCFLLTKQVRCEQQAVLHLQRPPASRVRRISRWHHLLSCLIQLSCCFINLATPKCAVLQSLRSCTVKSHRPALHSAPAGSTHACARAGALSLSPMPYFHRTSSVLETCRCSSSYRDVRLPAGCRCPRAPLRVGLHHQVCVRGSGSPTRCILRRVP